jgi:hypothetical protein
LSSGFTFFFGLRSAAALAIALSPDVILAGGARPAAKARRA